ncbi:MAG: hypothetical protein Q8L48_05305 [Archangium sp.]|nr:hypothetical protein [Archangium sp.]
MRVALDLYDGTGRITVREALAQMGGDIDVISILREARMLNAVRGRNAIILGVLEVPKLQPLWAVDGPTPEALRIRDTNGVGVEPAADLGATGVRLVQRDG